MATFDVYLDQENAPRTPAKSIIEGKVGQGENRQALTEIDENKKKTGTIHFKDLEPIKSDGKDMSEAFKEVKLYSKDEVENKKKVTESNSRAPFAEITKENNERTTADDSFDVSIMVFSPDVKREITERVFECSEYRDSIYQYLKKIEGKCRPKSMYMKKQPDITHSMRKILVDWLVEVAAEYQLHTETLFMSVSFVDRFLSSMAVLRSRLQLLGTSAMLLASKYEEIYPPEVNDFVYITDDTYTKKQVLGMEHLILKVLKFNLSAPTMPSFLQQICSAVKVEDPVRTLALYLCELTLLEGDPYFAFPSSLVVCGALALARNCFGMHDAWPAHYSKASGYSISELVPVVKHLNETHSKALSNPQTASLNKYKHSSNFNVSLMPHRPLKFETYRCKN